jgi:hypothetical protein
VSLRDLAAEKQIKAQLPATMSRKLKIIAKATPQKGLGHISIRIHVQYFST